jgi:hypothetical protein
MITAWGRWRVLAQLPFEVGAHTILSFLDLRTKRIVQRLYVYAGRDRLEGHGRVHRIQSADGREVVWVSPSRVLLRMELDGGTRVIVPAP